ncbi:hypothetical protein A2U01_0010379, partial [Trifolium medium]|nr:hypothetical protein [Trifolium medium]
MARNAAVFRQEGFDGEKVVEEANVLSWKIMKYRSKVWLIFIGKSWGGLGAELAERDGSNRVAIVKLVSYPPAMPLLCYFSSSGSTLYRNLAGVFGCSIVWFA